MYVKAADKSISMTTNPLTYNLNGFNSKPIDESIVSRGNTRRYLTNVVTYTETDVSILGAGSAGLSCAYELTKFPNVLIAIIGQSVSPGGGAWLGGHRFYATVVRKPSRKFLDELGIAYDEKIYYNAFKI